MTHTQTQGADGAGTKTAGEVAVRELEWLRRQVIELCEHTEDKAGAELERPDLCDHERGFHKGAYTEAKGIRRAIAETVRCRLKDLEGSTPAPAATPCVPDSLRALSEAACPWRFKAIRGLHEYAVATEAKGQKGPLNSADADFAAASANFVHALISAETTATPYGWAYIWTSDDCDGGAVEQKFSRTKPDATNPYISDIVPLFASHLAGQSAGQGELIRSLQIELSIAQGANRALKEWIKGYRIKGRFQALGQLPAGQAGDAGAVKRQPDELTESEIAGRAKKLLTDHGWEPGQKLHFPAAIGLMTKLGMGLLKDPPQDRCAHPVCGCDADSVCGSAPNSTRTGAAQTAVVPLEPTEEMWRAFGTLTPEAFRQKWAAALAARPEAPSDAGWNFDMEAAPQDGTRILLWMHGCWIHPVIGYRAPSAPGSQRDCWREHGSRARIHRVDCWRLIPAGPTPPSDPAPSGQAEG